MMSINQVLCYHALSPTWAAALSTTPERFERQMRLLLARGYRATTFTEAVAAPPRSGVVAVTFDDAFRSVVDIAFPILRRLGMVATLFVPTDFVQAGEPLCWPGIEHWLRGDSAGELAPASWGQISQLAAAGWEIGSHTASHPHLTGVEDASLVDELGRSKRACEEMTGAPCASVAYPYGDADDRVVAATTAAGYKAAAMLAGLIGRPDPMSWPRVGIYHADDERRFRMKVSPAFAVLRGTPAYTAMTVGRVRLRHET